ncbi:MAG TPA: hypothetical protein VHZ81_11680 [Galbitalea sp.]|nr:hypothetical protein [Galbitalea sp.]
MIDWAAFIVVAAVSIGSAAVLVAIFALGLRLLAIAETHRGVRVVAVTCFVVAAAGALYGVYLVIPSLQLA